MLNANLDKLVSVYGPVKNVRLYRLDLYPKGYVFESDGAIVTVTLFGGRVALMGVFFKTRPAMSMEDTLGRFSGLTGWNVISPDDERITTCFPMMNPKAKKLSFYAATNAIAMARKDPGELHLDIKDLAYPKLLAEYRTHQDN